MVYGYEIDCLFRSKLIHFTPVYLNSKISKQNPVIPELAVKCYVNNSGIIRDTRITHNYNQSNQMLFNYLKAFVAPFVYTAYLRVELISIHL